MYTSNTLLYVLGSFNFINTVSFLWVRKIAVFSQFWMNKLWFLFFNIWSVDMKKDISRCQHMIGTWTSMPTLVVIYIIKLPLCKNRLILIHLSILVTGLTKRGSNYIWFHDLGMVVMKIRILWISESNEQWFLSLMIIDKEKYHLIIQSEMRTIYPLRNLNKRFGLKSQGNWVRRQSRKDVRRLLRLKHYEYK